MSDGDKKKRSNTETARRIWLAGIGAYGRAFTEAQGALKEVTGKGSDVFDELVQKGEMIEKVVEYKGRELLDKTKAGDIELPNLEIDERIKRMRERLSTGTVTHSKSSKTASVAERLNEMEAQLTALTERVKTLEPKDKPLKKTAAKKKKPMAKATTQRTKKTAKPK